MIMIADLKLFFGKDENGKFYLVFQKFIKHHLEQNQFIKYSSCFEKNEKQPTFIFANFINCMVTLTNKDKRIKKLENGLNQEKDTNKVLRKRIADLEKKRKNYLK